MYGLHTVYQPYIYHFQQNTCIEKVLSWCPAIWMNVVFSSKAQEKQRKAGHPGKAGHSEDQQAPWGQIPSPGKCVWVQAKNQLISDTVH